MNSKIKKMCICGMMAAIAIVLDYISFKTEFTKITLYGLPLLLVGILFDQNYGLLTGLVEGIISQLICYGPGSIGLTTPIWMIAPMAWGFLSGLLIHKIKISKNDKVNIIFAVVITAISVTLINTGASFLDALIIGYSYSFVVVSLLTRILFSLLSAIIYCVVLIIVVPILKKNIHTDNKDK